MVADYGLRLKIGQKTRGNYKNEVRRLKIGPRTSIGNEGIKSRKKMSKIQDFEQNIENYEKILKEDLKQIKPGAKFRNTLKTHRNRPRINQNKKKAGKHT